MRKTVALNIILILLLLINVCIIVTLEKKKSVFYEYSAEKIYDLYDNSFAYYLAQEDYMGAREYMYDVSGTINMYVNYIQHLERDPIIMPFPKYVSNTIFKVGQKRESPTEGWGDYSVQDIFEYKAKVDNQYRSYLKTSSYYNALKQMNTWLKKEQETHNALY